MRLPRFVFWACHHPTPSHSNPIPNPNLAVSLPASVATIFYLVVFSVDAIGDSVGPDPQHKPTRAASIVEELLAKAPQSKELKLMKVECLMGLGKHEEAYAMSSALIRNSQNNSKLLITRARCLYLMGNLDSAIKHLQVGIGETDAPAGGKGVRGWSRTEITRILPVPELLFTLALRRAPALGRFCLSTARRSRGNSESQPLRGQAVLRVAIAPLVRTPFAKDDENRRSLSDLPSRTENFAATARSNKSTRFSSCVFSNASTSRPGSERPLRNFRTDFSEPRQGYCVLLHLSS